MKKIFSSLIVAIFAVTMMGVGTASAAWTRPATDLLAATWVVQDAGSDDVALLADPEYTFAGTIPQDSIITITLGGGAKFQEAPLTGNMTFTQAIATVPPATVSVIGAPVAGCTSFQMLVSGADILINDKLAIGDTTATTPGLDLSGVTSPGNVTISIIAENQAGTFTWLATATRVIVVADDIFSATNETASDTTQIDVAEAKKLLVVVVGGTTVATDASVYTVTRAAMTVPAAAPVIAIGKLLYTIEGDMSAVTTIGAVGITGSDSTGDQTGGVVSAFTIDATNNIAYASSTATLAQGVALALAPVITFDGTTLIPEGAYTIKATLIADVSYTAESLTAFTFLDLDYNGTTRSVYNIPGSANSDQAYVRIYNTSSIAGTVYGTLSDSDGVVGGNEVLIQSMAAGTTSVFSAADLEAIFGTWTGRAHLTIDGEFTDMEVMGLIRSSTGTITNMSSVARN